MKNDNFNFHKRGHRAKRLTKKEKGKMLVYAYKNGFFMGSSFKDITPTDFVREFLRKNAKI